MMFNTDFICCGCLCDDRLLSPLEDHIELYINLLGKDHKVADYINIQLCWECKALLRNTYKFKKRLQTAHHTLNQVKAGLLASFNSLSHLACFVDDKRLTVERTLIELNLQAKIEVNIKSASEELDVDTKDIKLELDDIKDEINDDDYAPNFETDDENICDKLPEKCDLNNGYYKGLVKTIKSEIDLKNPKKYYSKVLLSEEQIQMILEEKRSSANFLINKNRCELCVKGFKKLSGLKMHIAKKHSKIAKGPIKCTLCNYSAPTKYDYECHKIRKHGVYKCNLCNYTSQANYVMDAHLAIHEYKYQCLQCNLEFVRLSYFQQHLKSAHYNFVCDYCSKSFRSKRSIEKHIQRIHLTLECKKCNKTYSNYRSYRSHLRMSHATAGVDQQTAYCVECDKQFKNAGRYKRHLSEKHKRYKNVSFPCPACSKQFVRKIYMRNHYKLYHDTKNNTNYCELCDKYYVNPYALRKHKMYVHEKAEQPRDKMCSVCGRGFTTNRILTNHMRTHTGERPHQCEFCSAAFAQKYALQTHVRARHKRN